MMVPATNDPIEKLESAVDLFNNQDRPLPAEKLINEAITICQANNNNSCLGKAYSTYGFFFRSNSVKQLEKIYRENGFIDKTATFDNRLIKSKEYFEKSISYYSKINEYDQLTNAYLNLGFAHYYLNDYKGECEPYLKSIEYYNKNIETNPKANVALPPGIASYEDFISNYQKRAGCI